MILATICQWIGFGLGVSGILMLAVLCWQIAHAPAGHEDNDGFHHDR